MVKFGESEAFLINDNDFKNKIIDYLFNTINISSYRYNLLETTQQLNFLKLNEHYLSPNFKGYNYLLIFYRYLNQSYCAAVDRKNLSYHRDKVDIKKIPIYKIKVMTSQSIFRGTIMDCKLIKNIMIIKDCFQVMGNMIVDMDMIEKMNYLDNVIINQFQKDYCSNFTFKINKLYRYNMLTEVITNIIPKCSYDIQGLVFFPTKSGVSIIYVDKKTPTNDKVEISQDSPSYHMIHDLKNFLMSRVYSYETNGKKKNLLLKKTDISDVFELYDINQNNEKLGIAHIPSIKISNYCNENVNDTNIFECIYCKEFNKWIPLKITN
jgi:hypothetical protein